MLNSLSFPSICHPLSLSLSLSLSLCRGIGENRRDIEWFIDVSRGCLYSGRRLEWLSVIVRFSVEDEAAPPPLPSPPPADLIHSGVRALPFFALPLAIRSRDLSIAGDLDARPSPRLSLSLRRMTRRGSGVTWTRCNLFRSCRLDCCALRLCFPSFPSSVIRDARRVLRYPARAAVRRPRRAVSRRLRLATQLKTRRISIIG